MAMLGTSKLYTKRRKTVAATALAATLALSGCGYDVELQGGIFEMMGVAGSTASSKPSEPKMGNRAGIVVPPNTGKLPPPGSPQSAAVTADPSWPVDPEERQAVAAAEQRKAHAAFCEKALIDARIKEGPNHTPVMGPMGRCEPSLLDAFSKNIQ